MDPLSVLNTGRFRRSSPGFRIVVALLSPIMGLVAIGGSVWLIWTNEERAALRYEALKEGRAAVVSVSADQIDPAMDGRLVHVTGKAVSGSTLKDARYGVRIHALKLKRHVEMLQWVQEKEHNSEHYSYKKEWRDKPIDSSRFDRPEGHENPPFPESRTKELVAKKITVGPYVLGQDVTDQLKAQQKVKLGQKNLAAAAEEVRGRYQLVDGNYFDGNAEKPEIGDVRVRYTVLPDGVLSIVARQSGDGLSAYETKAGPVVLAEEGEHDAEAMFGTAEHRNAVETWIKRGFGCAGMVIGFFFLLGPVWVLGRLIPLLGSLTSGAALLVAVVVGLPVAGAVTGLAWLVYHPMIGGIVLVASLAVTGIGLAVIRQRRAGIVREVPPPAPGSAAG